MVSRRVSYHSLTVPVKVRSQAVSKISYPSFTVKELTRATAPVKLCQPSCTSDQIRKDLLIDFKSNLLGKDARKLNFSVEVMISVQILSKLGAPFSLELLGDCCDSGAVHLDVDLWDLR